MDFWEWWSESVTLLRLVVVALGVLPTARVAKAHRPMLSLHREKKDVILRHTQLCMIGKWTDVEYFEVGTLHSHDLTDICKFHSYIVPWKWLHPIIPSLHLLDHLVFTDMPGITLSFRFHALVWCFQSEHGNIVNQYSHSQQVHLEPFLISQLRGSVKGYSPPNVWVVLQHNQSHFIIIHSTNLLPSLKLTFSHQKMDGWNTFSFPFGAPAYFQVQNCC